MATEAKVLLFFPLKDDFEETSKQLKKVAKKHKGKAGGSGAGGSERDMSFYFQTYKEAVAAEKEMKKLKIKGIRFDY